MLDQVLDLFGIVPEFDLDLMKPGQSLTDITCRVLQGVSSVLEKTKPDLVLVHGDTTTSMAASLAAYYRQIPVGHVEAGLRTGNILAPWPEEMNRSLTGRIARLHFAPTTAAKANLLAENVRHDHIHVTGNTVIDALFLALETLRDKPELAAQARGQLREAFGGQLEVALAQPFVLVTGHRRENFGQGFIDICQAIKQTALTHPGTNIVYPVHLNPNVQAPVRDILGGLPNVFLVPPLPYLPFLLLLEKCHFVLTDSGGIQEEAPSLGKPVLVMRETTERPEAVEAGTVLLVGSQRASIVAELERLLTDSAHYERMAKAHNPYGDGKASARILDIILDWDGGAR